MVFLIQSAQNRDASALQAKLDELIRAVDTARNEFIGVEHLSEGLRWSPARTDLAIAGASRRGWIVRANGHLELTRPGREIARRVIAR